MSTPTLPQAGAHLSHRLSHQEILTSAAFDLSFGLTTLTKQTFNLKGEKGRSVSFGGSHQLRTSVHSRAYESGRIITSVPKGLGVEFCLPRRANGRAKPMQAAAAICASAFDARCAVAETQTLSRKSSSATIVSPPGKETLPMLDDGGSGFRGDGYSPYYRGDGSGGGSGGGGFPTSGDFPWGDFWFYIFLFLLRFLLMNIIGEGTYNYKYEDGRNKPIRRYA